MQPEIRVTKYYLEAFLAPDSQACELLDSHHVLMPDETDGFVLRVAAEEGYSYIVRLAVSGKFLGKSSEFSFESQNFTLIYPIKTCNRSLNA